MTTFPNRVWERTKNGWASRPADLIDGRRRALLTSVLTATSIELRNASREVLKAWLEAQAEDK